MMCLMGKSHEPGFVELEHCWTSANHINKVSKPTWNKDMYWLADGTAVTGDPTSNCSATLTSPGVTSVIANFRSMGTPDYYSRESLCQLHTYIYLSKSQANFTGCWMYISILRFSVEASFVHWISLARPFEASHSTIFWAVLGVLPANSQWADLVGFNVEHSLTSGGKSDEIL